MKTLKSVIGITILSLILLSSGCTTEDNSNVSPDTRSKFLGTWSVNESQKKNVYEVTISADPNAGNRVFINNFGGVGSGRATAFISGSSITLDPDQNIGNLVFNGSGTMNSGSNSMNWNYSINDGADLTYYTAVFTKK